MANTLYLLLPSKGVAQSSPDWTESALPFASVSGDGRVQLQGHKTWAELKDIADIAHHVVLILAASDVSLLHVHVPPMSAAKLKAALPNVLEEQLVGDLSEIALLPSSIVDGVCTVAVANRLWLETIHAAGKTLGANKLAAYPAQILAQSDANATTIIVEQTEFSATVTVRPQTESGFGLALTAANEDDLIDDVIQAVALLVPDAQLLFYVDEHQIAHYHAHLAKSLCAARANVLALTWAARISGDNSVNAGSLDMMRTLDISSNHVLNWRKWRWPLGLAAAALLVNLIGLNVEFFSLKREAGRLKEVLSRTYRSSFPQEPETADSLGQMRKKIVGVKKLAGQTNADDFVVLSAQFANVWDAVGGGSSGGISSVEYREHSLFIKPKSANAVPLDALRSGLQAKSLSLVTSKDGIWQVKPFNASDKQ